MTGRGMIAPGMHADICLFSRRQAHLSQLGSRGFLRSFRHRDHAFRKPVISDHDQPKRVIT
ncbi:hypothetical protein M3583_21760, partial [Bacillus subtilis]|nr:hypothetical protein [Bacillus subtilis]